VKTEDQKKLDCRICAVDQRALFCNDVVVVIATAKVVLDLYQTFQAWLIGNSFMVFFANNYAWSACFNKKIVGVRFFLDTV